MKEGQGQSRNTTNSAGLETVQPCITGSAPLVDDLRTCRREHPNWATTRVGTGVETEEAGARQIGRRVTPSFRCSPYMSVGRVGREEPYSDSSHTRTSRMRPVEHAYYNSKGLYLEASLQAGRDSTPVSADRGDHCLRTSTQRSLTSSPCVEFSTTSWIRYGSKTVLVI